MTFGEWLPSAQTTFHERSLDTLWVWGRFLFKLLKCDFPGMLLRFCCRYAVDLVVCVALGCDMFDCVFPTRTAVSSPCSTGF